MVSNIENVSIAILCGGKSSRMGRDKAKLKINGISFLLQLVNEFKNKAPLLISVANGQNYDSSYGQIVKDIYKECGPLGGLQAVLSACQTEYLFCVSVDSPLCDMQFLQELISYLSEGVDAVVPIDAKGGLYPVCAIYNRRIEGIIREQLDKKIYRIREIYNKINVCYVTLDKITNGDYKLKNINTPEEYAQLIR